MVYARPGIPIPSNNTSTIQDNAPSTTFTNLNATIDEPSQRHERFEEPGLPARPPNDAHIGLCTNEQINPIISVKVLERFSHVQHKVPLPNVFPPHRPVGTNKFYTNMLLGDHKMPIWTHPYSLWYSTDAPYCGIATTHIKATQKVYDTNNNPPQYFFSPIGIKSIVLGAAQFNDSQSFYLKFGNLEHMSMDIQLHLNEQQFVRFPVIQGMGFVTAVYQDLSPLVTSAVGFRSLQYINSITLSNNDIVTKYHAVLADNTEWLLYATNSRDRNPIQLELNNFNTITSQSTTSCVIQVVCDTDNNIDVAAGCYPISCNVEWSTKDDRAIYQFNYALEGHSSSNNTLMYALPHHAQNFTQKIINRKIQSCLESTVRGIMQGLITDQIEMTIDIPSAVQFEPYTTISGKHLHYSDEVLNSIRAAAIKEVEQDVVNGSNIDVYFAGKVLAKYAWILYVCRFILNDANLVNKLAPKLKKGLQRWIDNKQKLPFVYDTTWKGLISSGEPGEDFGNPYYNDHHFHFGYHVIACAIVAKVDESNNDCQWLLRNKDWVDSLIRDYNNPNKYDIDFPMFRSFDWFNGNSWAKGLFESGDGKDEESSSEDVNAYYAIKLWAIATHNQALMDLANVQLGILKTSINNYFLYADENNVMDKRFIPNKVSGILFENKIDHTTYFGHFTQYIQMIHALPITPISSYIRSPTFVKEEWDQKLEPILNDVNDGWRGVIMLNLALSDPQSSFDFFSSKSFSQQYLDNGQSLTWSLAYSGGFK